MERAVRMRIIKGMLAAFMTFSRIPIVGVRIDKEDMKYSMCFLPVIGIVIGLIQWGADAVCTWLGAGELMRVALMTAVPVLVTGGIHMDGFCDTTDAVSSYQTKERKLEILKDSNAGAFAVIYGVLWFVLYAGALSEIHTLVKIFACTYVISRAMAVLSVVNFRAARQDGMGAGEQKSSSGSVTSAVMVIWLLLSVGVMANISLPCAVAVIAAAVIVFFVYSFSICAQFGGFTGDLAGWYVQMSELVMALVVAVAELLMKKGCI